MSKSRINLPLTRVELDELRCPCGKERCGDTQIFLKGRCCEDTTETHYDRKDGCVTVQCAVCKKFIIKIKVAKNLFDL